MSFEFLSTLVKQPVNKKEMNQTLCGVPQYVTIYPACYMRIFFKPVLGQAYN